MTSSQTHRRARRALLLCALTTAPAVLGSAAAAPVQVAASAEYLNPVWAPDSRTIAVERLGTSSRDEDEIFTVREDGSHLRRLTNNSDVDDSPAWSPDGKKIAFSSSRRDSGIVLNENIYVMNADGSSVRRLTTRPGIRAMDDRFPQWSKDGRTIAFVCQARVGSLGSPKEVFLVTVQDRHLRRFTRTPRSEESVAWAPGGRILAAEFDGNYSYGLLGTDGRIERTLRVTGLSLWPAFDYSPDGKRIAFVAYPRGGDYTHRFIYLMSSSGSGIKKLTRKGGEFLDVDWAPNGKKLVFSRDGRLYVVAADGRNERPVPLP